MTLNFQFGAHLFDFQAESANETKGGLILHGTRAHVNMTVAPRSYFRHGWQSWSLTTWQNPNFQLPVQKPDLLHTMQTDPLYVWHPVPNGSWLGAVEIEDGQILLLGALGLDAHVALHGQQLHGWFEIGNGDWFLGHGEEISVFARYTELLGERLGKAGEKSPPRVWCSWYSLYTTIDESILNRVFDDLGDLPFDVLQVDDGWQISIGDWAANVKFPSGITALADKIKSTGRRAGLWLAPLIAVKSSNLFQEHPDWFLRDWQWRLVSAGFNWGEQLYALDTTHPDVLEWLAELMIRVRDWGFDYLKLDFLYAGALPGKRYVDMPREAAYRRGLQVMRAALGPDAYLLTCAAPIIPSLGLCDALRIGPDVAGEWENLRDAVLLYNPTTPGTRNAIRTTLNRLWLSPLVAVDPDVTYFSSQHITLTTEQKRMLQELAIICNFKATSDLPQWLSTKEREELLAFLKVKVKVERTGQTTFILNGRVVDFGLAMPLPAPPRGWGVLARAALSLLGNQGWALRLLDKMRKKGLEKIKSSA